jgi:hypothetical protein
LEYVKLYFHGGRGGSLYTKPLGGFFSRFGTSICYSSGRMAWASWATLLCLVAKTIALAIVVETAIGGFGRSLWRDNRMNQSGVLRILKKTAHSELMTIRSSPNNAVKSTLGQIIVIA